ncbi:MAG: SPOR domain-containing protein [Rickettsiales bacterium]|nr:SPOR domain-containing protein [Rickettsiales bacterium]
MRRVVLNANKISLVVSFLAFTASVTAVCISAKINNQVVEGSQCCKIEQIKSYSDNNKVIINDIPDTTIIRQDGSRVEVKSYKANDSLNGIIVNDEKINNSEFDNGKIVFNSNDVINVKSDTQTTRNEKDIQKENKTDNLIKITLPKNITRLSQEGVISGKYVIQTGAFKVRQQAQRQCERIRKSVKLQDKQCQYVFKNNQYRVIIFPFENKNSADEFAKILSSKKFPVLIKKNI